MANWIEGSGAATIAAALITVVWKPWSQDSKDRRAQKKLVKLFVLGAPAVKGIFDEVLTAPERMRAAEKKLELHDQQLGKIQRGITNLTREVTEFVKTNSGNGGGGVGIGDSLIRIERELGTDRPDTVE